MTVSVPSVDSAYSAESTDGTLTKSATTTVFFQCSKYIYFGAGAVGAVFRDTRVSGLTEVTTDTTNVIRVRVSVSANTVISVPRWSAVSVMALVGHYASAATPAVEPLTANDVGGVGGDFSHTLGSGVLSAVCDVV